MDHSIWSPDEKIMPPEKSLTQPYLTSRPACHSLSCPWGLTNGPHTLGRQSRGESKIERPHMSLQWTPEMATRVGLIIQGWTCTCMQRNTRTINANHWMEVNTSGGMDEIFTWIKGFTFRMINGQPTPNRLGRATPQHPSHNGC